MDHLTDPEWFNMGGEDIHIDKPPDNPTNTKKYTFYYPIHQPQYDTIPSYQEIYLFANISHYLLTKDYPFLTIVVYHVFALPL